MRQTTRNTRLAILTAALAVSLAATPAQALDVDVDVTVPDLDSIQATVVVGAGNADVDLTLDHDERGRLVRGGPCTVDGVAVEVKGKVITKKSGPQYAITCTGPGVKVKFKGALVDAANGIAKVSYKGPLGKAKTSQTVTLGVTSGGTASWTVEFDDQGGGSVTSKKGKITGTATVESPYGASPTGTGTVKGKLKNGTLVLKAKHGRCKFTFKGPQVVGGFEGSLTSSVPPDSQKIAAYQLDDIGSTNGGGGGKNATLADSLRSLGVKVEDSARKDYNKTEDLPEDYAPFGSQKTFNRIEELVMIGATLRNDASRFTVSEFDLDGDLVELADLDSAANDWVGFESNPTIPKSLRTICAGDVDGDGLEEILGIYMDDLDLTLKLVDDAQNAYAESLIRLGVEQDVEEIGAVAGDFDGDGFCELAVAVGRSTTLDVIFFDDAPSGFARKPAFTKTYTAALDPSTIYAQLRCGNLDFDIGCELAFVVNEYNGNGPVGIGTYVILDDWSGNAAQLKTGTVQGFDGGLHTPLVGSIAIGDIDGDDIDEVVLAGPISKDNDFSGTLVTAIDDVPNGMGVLGSRATSFHWQNNPAFGRWRLHHTHINTVDIDADGAFEIQVNGEIYDDFANALPWTDIYEIPQEKFLDGGSDASARFNDQGTQVITGDFSGDGRGDVLVYCMWQNEAYLWGLDQTVKGWREMGSFEAGFANTQSKQGAVLIAANVDTDSAVLDYGEGSYKLVFTEPIIIAALAAPPCGRGIGQNVDGCETAFGQATSTGNERETAVSISAKAIAGFKIDGGVITQSEFEMQATSEVTATRIASHSYTLEETITYVSGPNDDAVVFTTVPLDQYTYTIVSHPDPDLIGDEIVISLPRKPITVKTDRSFYNANVAPGSLQIDDTVFQHTIGDLSTYPTASRKNQLLQQYGGLQSSVLSVSQGDRAEEVQLAVSNAIGSGRELEVAFELEVKATGGGVVSGFSVGTSASSRLTVTSGSSTIYTGRIGDIDAENFAANQYSFGLFTYVFRHASGQEFEVLNYWVE